MTFEELWKTLPIPWGYRHMDELDQSRWKAVVEAAFRTGLFEGAHKSASANTADSKRISDLEAAVAEIRAAMQNQIDIKRELHRTRVHALTDELDARSKHAEEIAALKAELRNISEALDDPRVDNTITAVEAIKNLRAALKVIYTWCCYPDDFDFGKTKAACMFALRGSRQ
jgi:outer membrane protein assembly factor BamA